MKGHARKTSRKEKDACKDFSPHKPDGPSSCPPDGKPETQQAANTYADKVGADKCLSARRCQLTPYTPTKGQAGCCPGQTGHHLVEAGSFFNKGRGEGGSKAIKGTTLYNQHKAPCICVEGRNQYHGTHGLMHTYQSNAALNSGAQSKRITFEDDTSAREVSVNYGQAKSFGVAAVGKTFPESGCDPACTEAQLDAYHNQCGIDDQTDCRMIATGYKGDAAQKAADKAVIERSEMIKTANAPSMPTR